jgi:SpoVK/Ycf46/Vps4 family AAA+-type ATPase
VEQFHIVSALCRQIVKEGASKDALSQMERLYQDLRETGNVDDAKVLKRLINRADTKKMIEPSNVSLSKTSYLKGQTLTPNSKVPVDKDSGSPLAKVVFAEELAEYKMPIFPQHLSEAIKQLIKEWDNVDKLREFGVSPSLSCLLFGLPGTGKTQLALYIANMLSLPVVLAKLDGLVSSLLGTSARNITNLFNFASQHKCILLLDEFDAVAKARDDNQEVGEIKRIVNTLLQCIDERTDKGMTIAITNHEILLDPAVWRRFDVRVYVPKPDECGREKILREYLYPLELSDEKIKFLSVVTDNFCGSDLKLMTTHFKRRIALCEDKQSFIDTVRALLTINASTTSELATLVRKKSDTEVMHVLNKTLDFNQREIGKIFDTSYSRVSRMIKDLDNHILN